MTAYIILVLAGFEMMTDGIAEDKWALVVIGTALVVFGAIGAFSDEHKQKKRITELEKKLNEQEGTQNVQTYRKK